MARKVLWWAGAAAALIVVAQIGTTTSRSEDLRVAVLDQCRVAKGRAESGGGAAAAAIALGNASAGVALSAAAQIAKAYGQPHVSPPLAGATADHFYYTDGKGNLFANNEKSWRCVAVMVKDLRAPTAASAAPAPADADEYSGYRFYFEALISHSADRAAFEIKPVLLRFRQPQQASLLGSSARDLSLTLSFSKPGAKEPFAQTVFDFKALLPSATTELRAEDLGSEFAKRSGWLPAYPLDDTITRALAVPQAAPSKHAVLAPTNLLVTVVESREGSLLWKLLGDVLNAVTPTIKDQPAAAPPTVAAPKGG